MLANRMMMGAASTAASVYGVDWDEDNSSPTLTRTGDLTGVGAGSSPGNASLPVQALMKRCILQDNGAVNYYLCATDSTKKENCSTAANLDGTDGQVMVEIPLFWYLYEYDSDTNVHSWSISLEDQGGDWERHPAFYKNGSWVNYRYIGAYDGSMYDASATAMASDANAVAECYASGDKLCSVTGQCPKTNETRAEFRAMAAERGSGWRQMDFALLSAVQLLYLVEYADFDSQSMIGMGRTELTGGTWVADSYIGKTGKSNSDGNTTANVEGNTNNAYMSYRGIENFFGNIWKWVDGININSNAPYVSNTDTDFADDTTTDYSRLVDSGSTDVTLANANGWATTLERISEGFLPSAVGGSDATYLCDYYYQATGWRVVRFGDTATAGSAAGAFCVYASHSSSVISVVFGGRLCF